WVSACASMTIEFSMQPRAARARHCARSRCRRRERRWYNFCPALRENRHSVLRLIASPTSPYVRKVRIALAEKKIEYQLVEVSPWTPDNPVHEWSPLGKVPVLVLDDGTRLFDSRVIVDNLHYGSPVSAL